MGTGASLKPAVRTWKEICEDSAFQNLPYKIETDNRGNIFMSPMYARHGFFQTRISIVMNSVYPEYIPVSECAVKTAQGTKVADIAFFTKERWEKVKDEYDVSISPEIAVEVLSFSNSIEETLLKKDLYFAAGSVEFWICDFEGNMEFYAHSSKMENSFLCPNFPKTIKPD